MASGLGREGGKGSGLVPKRSLSPEVPREGAERIACEALPGAAFGPLTAHPKAALRRRLFRAAAAVAGLTALVAGFGLVTGAEPVVATWVPAVPLWSAAAAFAVTAPLAVLYARGCYKGLGHGLSSTCAAA